VGILYICTEVSGYFVKIMCLVTSGAW